MSTVHVSYDDQYWTKRRSHSSPLGHSSVNKTMFDGKPFRLMTNGRASPKGKLNGSSEESINLKTVERIDPGVSSIIRTVSCVVVYEYLEESEAWERTSMEGTLFVYNRQYASEYSNAFLILSKLTNNNLLVRLDGGMMVHTQYPFVLFRKSINDKVYGLNFTDEAICLKVGEILLRLCQGSRPTSPGLGRTKLPQQDSLSIDRLNLTPSPPCFSDYSGEGDSQEEGAGSDSQRPIPEHPSHHHQRQENARKQRTSMSRRTSEPISISTNNKSRTKREVSPLSSRSSSSRSNPKSSGQFQVQNVTTTPTKLVSNNKSKREKGLANVKYNSGSVDTVRHYSQPTSPSLVKKLFQEGQTDQTPTVLSHLFAHASSSSNPPPVSSTSSYVSPAPPLLQKLVSVAEIEEQMSSDVSGTHGVQTTSNTPIPVPSSQHVLLHPSAFSFPSPIENIPPNGQATQASTETTDHQLEVNIQVQPPTPVAVSSNLLLLATRFPSIPGLVHSPGMRSQPVTVENHTPSIYQSSDGSTQSIVPSEQYPYSSSSGVLPRLSLDAPPINRPLSDAPPTTSSSSLITPMLFSSPAQRSVSEPSKTMGDEDTTIGLTKHQLQQALLYLIKNDGGFISTLHEAYISSLKSSTR